MTENPFKNKVLKIYLFGNDGIALISCECPLDSEADPLDGLHFFNTGLRRDDPPIRGYAWKIVEKK